MLQACRDVRRAHIENAARNLHSTKDRFPDQVFANMDIRYTLIKAAASEISPERSAWKVAKTYGQEAEHEHLPHKAEQPFPTQSQKRFSCIDISQSIAR
jgi:hypothetical protein